MNTQNNIRYADVVQHNDELNNTNDLLTYNRCCLTTIDNPFNPLTQFVEWFSFDIEKGYNCCGLLARICPEDSTLSEPEKWKVIEEAIDFVVLNHPLNIYTKVIEGKEYSYPIAGASLK